MHAGGQIDGIRRAFRILLRIRCQAEREFKPSRLPLQRVRGECHLPNPTANIPAHAFYFAVPDPENGGRKLFPVTIRDLLQHLVRSGGRGGMIGGCDRQQVL